MKKLRHIVSLMLVFCMVFSLAVTSFAAFGESRARNPYEHSVTEEEGISVEEASEEIEIGVEPEEEPVYDRDVEKDKVISDDDLVTIAEPQADSNDEDGFIKIFHLDCGRKYFSVEQIKALIDTLTANDFTHLELAIGNDGLRFLLDDMSVTANDTTYSSDAVKAGIQAGNKAYYDAGTNELTQAEMDAIIEYATEKKIAIIPLLNTPGHMDAILDCMESVGISNPAYNNSARTVDVTNTEAVNFTLALVNKYITYFADKGCTYFNMGCDEYANDAGNGFAGLISSGNYGAFVKYVNNMATQVQNAGMTPIAFNDGIYYNEKVDAGIFDTKIVVAYWTSGWGGYTPASASFLEEKGHKIINTNDAWYYVLGRTSGSYSLSSAQNGAKNTSVTYVPGDNDPTLIGAMQCLWCDTPSAAYNNAEVANVNNLISTLADSNPTYFANALESKTVTVTIGGTAKDTIEGADYSNNVDKTELDESIATVSVELTPTVAETYYELVTNGADGIVSGEKYLIVTANSGTAYALTNAASRTAVDINNGIISTVSDSGAVFTLEGSNGSYIIKDKNGKYIYPDTSYNNVKWNYSISKEQTSSENVAFKGSSYVTISRYLTYNGLLSHNTTAYIRYSNKSFSAESRASNFYLFREVQTTGEPSTTVTFTGVSVGTTYVTVGNTRYTINVVAEDLSTVKSLPVEYWITNLPVTAGGATSTTISAQSVYGEAGVELSTLVPATGSYAYGSVVYWKGTVLDANNHQTSASGVENDKTGAGKDFNKLRYYNGNWQYFYEADGTWNTISSTDQVVAYWLQPTEVTKEITTLVKDWGYAPDGQGNDHVSKVALTVAVVYPDGTVSPAEGNMYSNSTTLFNYWTNRDIGLVAPINNSDYEISKITVTDGKRDQSGTGQWGVNDTITWEKVPNEAGEQWYKETTYWTEADGGTPMVNGLTSNITWSNYNTAKLVLIYLKPVHYDTNLTVNWVDDSASGALISTMEVAVSSDGTPTTFYNGLVQSSALPTVGVGGTFTLDDNAYVTNSSGINQPFNKNISTVPGVADKYKSGLYQYISAELSADGKTLTLHYDIDSSKLSQKYVVDFGLPVEIPISDLVENYTDVKNVTSDDSNVKYNSNDGKITYTFDKVLTGTIAVKVTLEFNVGGTQQMTIGFVPASNVMYEETFMTKSSVGNDWTHTDDDAITPHQSQTVEELNKEGVHGYDEAYSADTEFSKGSYYQATLSIPDGKTFSQTSDALSFTFTGTGFDLISECGKNTGMLYVKLYKVENATETLIKGYLVDTYFTGDTEFINGNGILSYQIPVVRNMELAHGTYKVEVYGYLTKGAGVFNPMSTYSVNRAGSYVSDIFAEMGISAEEASMIEVIYMDENSVLNGGTGVASSDVVRDRAMTMDSSDVMLYNISDEYELNDEGDTNTSSAVVYVDGFRVYQTMGTTNEPNYAPSEQGTKYASVYEYAVGSAMDYEGDTNFAYVLYVEGDSSLNVYDIKDYRQQGPQNEVYLRPGAGIAFELVGYHSGDPNNIADTVQVSCKTINGSVSAIGLGSTGVAFTSTEMYYIVEPKNIDGTTDRYYVFIANDSSSYGILVLSNLKLENGITAVASDELRDFFAEQATTGWNPETFTVKAPETLTMGRNGVISISTSLDADMIIIENDAGEQIPLTPNNTKAVERGRAKLYTYNYALNTWTLGASTHHFTVKAVKADNHEQYSAPVTVTVIVVE